MGKNKTSWRKGDRLFNLLQTNQLGTTVIKISNAMHKRKGKSESIPTDKKENIAMLDFNGKK
jgi:hypothetical protein